MADLKLLKGRGVDFLSFLQKRHIIVFTPTVKGG